MFLSCICKIARKYHLTWKLKKCQWFPKAVEYVGVDISTKGNSPAASKSKMLIEWPYPKSPRAIMSFIGFAIFYMKWIPYFELRILPLRNLIKKYHLDHKFKKGEIPPACEKVYKEIKTAILSKPILQRADIKKRFYLKTDFSSAGLGFALCQPDNSPEALAAMHAEDKGGECQFDLLTSSKL